MIDKIKKLWNGIIIFTIISSILVLFAQILLVLLILNTSLPIAFTLITIFFIIDTIVIITFSKKRVESDIINISFIVLVLSSPLVYGLLYYLKIFYLPLNPQMIHIGSVDTWITFSGSIISGLLVMISLVYTIKYERSMREFELTLTNIPIIEFELAKSDDFLYNKNVLIKFEIKNIGNTHIRNLKIEEMNAYVQYQSPLDDFDRGILGSLTINHLNDINVGVTLMPINKTHEIYLRLFDKSELIGNPEANCVVINTEISYWNILIKNEFRFKSTISFSIIKESDKYQLRFFSNTSLYDPDTYNIKSLN